MSTMYTPLKASRREVRLISIRSDLHKHDGGNLLRNSIPDGTLKCTMKTVSLNDWTPDYADFQAKTIDWPYSPTILYEEWEHFSREKNGSMDDDKPTPERFVWEDYETISYTWENGSNTQHTIYVNDGPFVVQDNLFLALQEFRRSEDFVEGRRRMLWADAICINQDDLDERATEVKRMKKIFSTATRSTIWFPSLDLNGTDTKVYFDLIERVLDNLYKYHMSPSDDSSTEALQSAVTELASSEAESLEEHDLKTQESLAVAREALAIISLFNPAERPSTYTLAKLATNKRLLALLSPIFLLDYWNRAWIIQELTVSSRQTVIRAGSSPISFARLSWFAGWFVKATIYDPNWSPDDEYTRTIMNSLLLLSTIYEVQLQLKPDEWKMDSEYIWIIQGLMARSSLPLDKLYGVLGLLQPSTYLGIDVDYKKTVRQGSIDAAIALIRAGKALRSFDVRRELQSLQVPSWVVDLSIDHDSTRSLAAYFRRRSPADIPEVDWDLFWERQAELSDQGILSLRAIYLDTVDGVAACVPVESGGPESLSQKVAQERNIDVSATEPTRLRHSYRDDSEMLAQLDAILRSIPNWQTDGFGNQYYEEGSPNAFILGILAVSVELGRNGSSGSNHFGVSAATATELSSLKQFLDASADFKLWKDKLSSFFPGIGKKPGSSISTLLPSDIANLLDTDGLMALEDMMQLVNLWTLHQVRLVTTMSGYLGVAAQLARQGDMIYAVEGYRCPVILRPIENADTFEFIGLAEICSPAVSGTWENMTFDCIVRLQ